MNISEFIERVAQLNCKDRTFFVFGVISSLLLLTGFIFCLAYKKKLKKRFGISAWKIFTGVVFVSTLSMHLPVYYLGKKMTDGNKCISPFIMSFFQTLRTFILDGELSAVVESLDNVNSIISLHYVVLAVVLFVLCPAMVAKLLWFIFRNSWSKFKFDITSKRPIYIMSRLNSMSVALATSIYESSKNSNASDKKPLIIFTDVQKSDDEQHNDLLEQIKEMGALYLKQDVTALNIFSKKEKVDIFLMSEDESENVDKAIKLQEKRNDLKDKKKKNHRIKVYVYSSSEIDGHIIDSIDKEEITFDDEIEQKVKDNKSIVDGISSINNGIIKPFDICRVDYTHDFAVSALENSNIFEMSKKWAPGQKVISILIAGIGKFGKEILKTALWYCQIEGYKLEINVIDRGADKRNTKFDIINVLKHECPEIMSNISSSGEEGTYDIEIYNDVDCFDNSLDNLFARKAQRLIKTQVAFVTLGSDDKNIDAAIELRRQFDRLFKRTNSENGKLDVNQLPYDDQPLICAVVFNDKTASNMSKGLIDHRKTPYNITFIGSLSEIFSYDKLQQKEDIERKAIRHHVEWLENDKNVANELSNCTDSILIADICKAYGKQNLKELQDEIAKQNERTHEQKIAKCKEELEKYHGFEYYRHSSIAKAIHKEMIERNFPKLNECIGTKNFICMCENCKAKRKTEHMRWMAYMRVYGFRYSKDRCDRGKTHNNLIKTEELNIVTQLKDV